MPHPTATGQVFLSPEAVSWVNLEVVVSELLTVSLNTMKKMEYGDRVVPVPVYGAGQQLVDYTAGYVEILPVKLEIGVHDWAKFYEALVLYSELQVKNIEEGFYFTGQNGMELIQSANTQFTINCAYAIPSNNIVFCDTLNRCRITGVTMSSAQGPDPVTVSLEMVCLQVQRSIL